MTTTMDISAMPTTRRLEIVLRKAASLLPGGLGRRLLELLSPTALAVMAGVVVIWAGSHFVGVGEVADVVLLAAGWLAIGGAALDGGRKLVAFATGTASAKSAADLDRAARDLANAITILAIDVVLGLLLRGKPKTTFREPFRPEVSFPKCRQFASVMPKGGPTRMYEAKIVFTRARDAGRGGTGPVDNLAKVGRGYYPEAKASENAIRDVRRTVHHERVHQRLTQAFSLLGRPALYMKLGAYKRSYILRYIEEAAAEAYGIAKSGGVRPGELTEMQFPLNGSYGITLAKMGEEAKGILLGPVVVGGATLNATFRVIDDDR
jgi:hypothetical protein